MTVENLHDAIGLLPSDLIAKVDEARSRKPKRIPFRRYAAMAACLALILCAGWFCTRLFSAKGGASESIFLQAADEEYAPEAQAPAAREPESNQAAPTQAPMAISGGSSGEKSSPTERSPEEEAYCAYPDVETFAAEDIPPEGVTEPEWTGYPEFPAEDVQYADTRSIGSICIDSAPELLVLRTKAELDAYRAELDGWYTLEAFDGCCERYDEGWFETHDLLIGLIKGLSQDGTFSLASVTESDGDWCVRFYSGGPYSEERIDRFVFAALEKGMIPEGSRLFAMFEVP